MTDQFQEIFGGRIHYASHGPADADRTLLCLHGNSSSAGAFEKIAAGLVAHAHDMRVICVDFPGHGLSDGADPFKPYYSFQGLGDVVIAFINAIGIEPFGIIGHSMGGHIAIKAAPDIPSLRKLVLISSPPIAGAQAISGFFRSDAPTGGIFAQRLSEDEMRGLSVDFSTPNASQSAIAAIHRDIARTDGVFRSELGASLSGADITDELSILKQFKHIDCYLIGGEQDRFINPNYYAEILTALKLNADDRNLLPDTGHYPHLERPEETLNWIKNKFSIPQFAQRRAS